MYLIFKVVWNQKANSKEYKCIGEKQWKVEGDQTSDNDQWSMKARRSPSQPPNRFLFPAAGGWKS